MTRFLTVSEMIERVGADEMRDIAGIGNARHEDGRRVDEVKVESQIHFAEEKVMAHLRTRYQTVVHLTPEKTPSLIKGFVEDIARYRLRGRSNNQNQVTDVVFDRYKDACAMLEKISMGKVSVDIPGDPRGDETRSFAITSDIPDNRSSEILAGYSL